jgi:hypothetical protein
MTAASADSNSVPLRDLAPSDLQKRAENWVRAQHGRKGVWPTGKEVGEKFGMQERWGRNRVNAVRDETADGTDSGTGAARTTVGEAVEARAAVPPPAVVEIVNRAAASDLAAARVPPHAAPVPPVPSPRAAPGPRHDSGTALISTVPLAPTTDASGKFIARLGFTLGSVVSIAANVVWVWLHPPAGAASDWVPSLEQQIMAAAWPTFLLITVEIMTRVRWPHGGLWIAARFGGVGVVALGSAIISYGHHHDVLLKWQYSGIGASVGPLVVDGFMVVTGFALLAIAQGARKAEATR